MNKDTVVSELDTLDSASKQVSAVESLTFSNKKEKTILEKESTTESRNGQFEIKIMSSKGKKKIKNNMIKLFSENTSEKKL